ncbi:MAG: EFR1 family ferrodoxin [Anaerolineales bacterium]
MKAAVRYFSGTGNSWRIASACAERFQASGYETDLKSIRRGEAPDPDADAACFCFPVHALDLPRNAFSYLRGLPQSLKNIPTILLVTGGDPDNCGWALRSGARLLAERGYPVQIADLILMPNNWTPFHSGPDREEAERIIGQGVEKAEDAVSRFMGGETRTKPISLRKFGPIGSILMRTLYHRRGVYKLWMFFETGTRCNGCGLCARICPTGSIRMEGGKPVWSVGCVQCMRCFNYCPNRAIRQLEPLLHGSRHNAYHLPGFNPLAERGLDRIDRI